MAKEFPFDIEYISQLLGLRVRRRCADGVYTDCPFCADTRGRMKLNYLENVWRCNRCGEKGGMLRLYALSKGITTAEASQEICDCILNGENCWETGSLPAAQSNPSRQEPVPQQARRAEGEAIHKTLTAMLDMLTLSKHHREHLRSVRGLSDQQIDRLGYKSTPPYYQCKALADRLVKKGFTVEGVPGFYRKDGQWTVRFPSVFAGIIIPVRGVDGKLHGCQIRLDKPMKYPDDPPDKQGAKYVWLSSNGKPDGTASGSPIHLVGDNKARVVYLTEGILKSDIAHTLMHRTFVGVAGISNTAQLDMLFAYLAANGTQEIVLAPDIDRYLNPHVSEAVAKIITMVQRQGLRCKVLSWNPNYKGVDDWQLALLRRPPAKEPEEIPAERQAWQKYRIYQLDVSLGKVIPFAYGGYRLLQKAGFEQPPASEYRMVHDGVLPCLDTEDEHQRLMRLVRLYSDSLPQGYQGGFVAPSDVIELYDENTRKYYYRDEKGFWPVQFSPALVKQI